MVGLSFRPSRNQIVNLPSLEENSEMASADLVTWIDRTKCHRDRPMEVLCLGPGRTGTDSMRVALKTLGFDDCYHGYSSVMENPPDNYLWQQAMDWKLKGKGSFGKTEWDQLLGHCRAVSDLPCVLFSKELIETYPEAKVILTHPPKGFERWHESCCETIVQLRDDWKRTLFSLINYEARLTRNTFFRSFDAFWRNDFRTNARAVYEEHCTSIRELVAKDNLLEYDVAQGWEPLAEFLNVSVPETEFPAGNDPQNFFSRFGAADRRRRQESISGILKVGAIVAVGAAIFWRIRTMQ